MARDDYVPVTFHMSYKTVQKVEKLAAEYGLSKANTMVKLIEAGITAHSERLEVTTTNSEGFRNAKGVPVSIRPGLRDLL